jgi:predicted transport protein
MKQLIILSVLFSSLALNAQKQVKTKDTSTVNLELMGEKIQISQKRIDSLMHLTLDRLSSILNDVDNQKQIKKSIDSLGSKMNKVFEILIEDKNQLDKVKKEMNQKIVESRPQIDSAIQQIKTAIQSMKSTK